MNLKKAIKESRAYLCLECGKCTGSCPVSRFNHGYSPRILVNKAIRGGQLELLKDKNIWACLTCKLCDERCPANIDYINLTLAVRFEAQKIGEEAICSHGGAAQSLMRIMSTPDLQQKRMDWIDSDLKVTGSGETLYFVGCLPYFDVLFKDIEVNTIRAAKASIRILNHLGITPVVLPNERCCGHDLLWGGELENFKRLARHNIDEINKAGVKKIIFSCPEGYRTFKIDYPKYFECNFEVQHITGLIAGAIDEGKIKLKELNKTVSFQDPCRLGRHLGIYDEPRKAIESVPQLKLKEMARSRNSAICCGVSAWMNCSTYSKSIQLARLKEAKQTGADLLVLACPKCEIHFNCAMKDEKVDEDVKIETIQLVTLIADLLNGG
jgi:heterodisulfide reductase subunit D